MFLNSSQAQAVKGKKYALLVGVRAYDHRALRDLKHTENDVEELGALLGKSSFTEVVVLTTTRGEKRAAAKPTAQNIRAELKRLLKKVTKHDTMLLALSGHGLQFNLLVDGKPKDESFFCPANAKPRKTTDLKELSETMLGYSELFQKLDDSGVGVKLLLVDACRNTPAGLKSSDVDSVPLPTRGTAALFSCKSGERSHEVEKLKHGIFFHFVIEGLRGKATGEEGEVTWDDLSRYVRRQVSRQSPKLIADGDKQTPHEIRNLEGDSPILIAPAKEKLVKGVGQGDHQQHRHETGAHPQRQVHDGIARSREKSRQGREAARGGDQQGVLAGHPRSHPEAVQDRHGFQPELFLQRR